MKIKKNDTVIVMTGKDKGKKGKVLRVFTKEGKVIVEGLNMQMKHKRPNRKGLKGEVVEIAAPMNVSNVMLEDPKSKKPTRVGYKDVNGKKIRISRKSGNEV